MFTIFYSDAVCHGLTAEDWRALSDHDVQVVVEWRPPVQARGELRYAGVHDRMLWSGEDTYDPFGWGVKFGRWMDYGAYMALFERAAHGR